MMRSDIVKAPVVAILSTKALQPESGPKRDECTQIWVIKKGHALVWSTFEIFINSVVRGLPLSLT